MRRSAVPRRNDVDGLSEERVASLAAVAFRTSSCDEEVNWTDGGNDDDDDNDEEREETGTETRAGENWKAEGQREEWREC
jgi:hypothetical protein